MWLIFKLSLNFSSTPLSYAHYLFQCVIFAKIWIIMNALRQYVTTIDGNVILKLPAEYTRRRLEIIVLPADDLAIPEDKFYTENLSKIMAKQENANKLNEAIETLRLEAAANGLTEEILNDILNESLWTSCLSLIPIRFLVP